MKITRCKLKKSIQRKLLQFFALEVTARSATDLLGIHPNSTVLFYRKVREVIGCHPALEAGTVFDDTVKANTSAVRQVKWQSSVFSNAAERFIPW